MGITMLTFGIMVSEELNAQPEQVLLCHVPPGTPDARHEILVSSKGASAHLKHGDRHGSCRSVIPQ